MPDKPVVFLAFANDREGRAGYLRNLPAEARRLAGALEGARQGGLCEVVVRANVTLEELFGLFQSAEYRDRVAVLHYGGHAEGYGLLLEGEGGVEAAHGAGLAELLGTQRGLRLVFLNGCATEPQAQGLLASGVSAVLVTSQAIEDEVALAFAGHFYAGLGGGASLRTAYAEAKAAVTARRGAGVARGLGLYRPEVEALAERWPWALLPKPGAEQALDWSLPKAAGDPLFGLPQVAGGDLPESPYRHLQPFGRAHAALFFGRGEAIRTLYERVTGAESPPLILLYGRSGVGKSSLLEAGLLARLEASHALCYRRREPARGLWGTVVGCLGEDLDGREARARWRQREAEAGKALLIVLDQVEEVYTRPHPSRPEELAECLDALQQLLADPSARPQGKLILGFRQEWLPELEQALAERELPRSAVYLPPLDRGGLIEAITGPSRVSRLQQRYGLSIEAGLAETMADTLLADPEAPLAPTLQVLLAKLWAAARARDPARPYFDGALFRALKREGLLLGDYLDQQLAAIGRAHPQAVGSGLVLDLLADHTTARGTAEGRSEAELKAAYAHGPELAALIESCQQGYLLLPTPEGGTRLGHDTLAPLIRERFEESDRAGQRARRILESRTLEWGEERPGPLLDEADLAIVETGQAGMRVWIAPERRLVEASRRAREKRTRQRKVYRALGLMAILAVVLSAALATWQWRQADATRLIAERQSRLSLARQLAAEAQAMSTEYPIRALLLATEAVRGPLEADGIRLAGPETVLRDLLALPRGSPLVHDPASGVVQFAFDPRGRWLATWGRDSTVRLWALEERNVQAQELRGHEGRVEALVFDPRGRWLATWDGKTLRLWDLDDRQRLPVALHGQEGSVSALTFGPKGRWLGVGSSDGSVRLWALREPQATPVVLSGHEGGAGVAALAFDPQGRWLATASGVKVRLWDLEEHGSAPLVISGHQGTVSTLAFDPQGRWLATGGKKDKTVRLWALQDLEAPPVLLRGHDTSVWTLAFDPQGGWLATLSGVEVRLWDLEDLGATPVMLPGDKHVVRALAFDPQGRWLATGGRDNAVRLWDLEKPGASPVVLRGHDSVVRGLAFGPRGRWLATRSWDKAVRLWDLEDPRATPVVLGGHEGWVWALAFDPRGRWLATASGGNVRLWDLGEPEASPVMLRGHEGTVQALAFDPRNRWLAAASGLNVRLWDLGEPSAPPLVLRGHEYAVIGLAFDPEGRWLATGSDDTTVRLWDLEEPDAPPVVLRGHEDSVRTLAFDWQGRWLATGAANRVVRLWDLKARGTDPVVLRGYTVAVFDPRGRWLATTGGGTSVVRLWDLEDRGPSPVVLRGHERSVNALAFDPQGRWLATGGDDTVVRLWELRVEELLRRACEIAGRNLMGEEWARHVGDTAYRETCPEHPVPPS